MTISQSKVLLTVVLIIWLFTIFRSITIMIGGKQIFIKANKSEKSVMYPILNIFTMLEIAEVSTYYGILLFVPVVNLIVLSVMSYKLGTMFKTSFVYKLGLVILPILFYPLLGKSDKVYKLRDEDYFKALDNAKAESINLMTDEEIKTQTVEDDPENNVTVDSVFKSQAQVMEQTSPYKAAKIDLLGMEKLQRDGETKSIDDIMKPQEEIDKEKNKDIETIDL